MSTSGDVTESLAERLKEWDKQKKNYWLIHGEYYNLQNYIEKHPGGETFILLGKGRNCTELFESVHCLSNRNFQAILKNYHVPRPEGIPQGEEPFSWEKGQFYDSIRSEVRELFNIEKKPMNYKANLVYWIKLVLMISLWFYCFTTSLTTSNFAVALCSVIIAGAIIEMLGFCLMHDGSHGALSKKGWINIGLMSIWNLWMLWCPWIWLRHHTYGHHSYTGIHGGDPDINNSKALLRKHENTKYKSFYRTQAYHCFFFLMFMPNQHFGQSIQYTLALVNYLSGKVSSRIFGLPLENLPKKWLMLSMVSIGISFYIHFVLPFWIVPGSAWKAFVLIFVYWSILGTSYFMNVAPNHETLDTHETMQTTPLAITTIKTDSCSKDAKIDWGVQQVVSSANHSISGNWISTLVTHCWGGMNYQIEHHLFPAVCHVHYPAISVIVQRNCEKFGIKYNYMTWWESVKGYRDLLSYFSVDHSQKNKKKTN